jgi:hypothetical protein
VLYSIQNASGEVYGIFPMPSSNQSPEVWAAELGTELSDILGINGVKDSPLCSLGSDEVHERVVIDIDHWRSGIEERIERVHETIARLATTHC